MNTSRDVDTVHFAILGTLEAHAGGRRLPLGPLKQRIVLGALLCYANKVVSVSALSDALWDDFPPRTAHKNIQVHISALRAAFGLSREAVAAGEASLEHSAHGYVIRLGSDQLDALAFHELVRAGRSAARGGDSTAAAGLLGEAVRMWRGPALPDLVSARIIATEVEQLQEKYLVAYEDWAEAELALGRHAQLLDGIDELARRHPLRERLRHAQMLALYRSGRRAEALAQFDAMRLLLARELGLRPSPVLARFYEAMLSGGRALDLQPADTGRGQSGTAQPGHAETVGRDIGDFTGRRDDINDLIELLSGAVSGGAVGGVTVVVSGMTGIGKTALAVHCAHRLAQAFPGGRFLVGLRAADGGPRSAPEVLGDLRESKMGPRTLFILDDAVTEAQVRTALSALGDCCVLVTSRRHLGGVESAVHVALEPLSDAESVELLGRLVGIDRIEAEPEMARRIARACGGLPLAIRIAGAKLAGLRHLTLARFAARLDDEERLLDELAVGDLELRSRLKASYESLDVVEQSTLRYLASPDCPTFVASEAAVWLGTDAARAEAAIERLVEARLVEVLGDEVSAHAVADARYRLPSLIRVYVREIEP